MDSWMDGQKKNNIQIIGWLMDRKQMKNRLMVGWIDIKNRWMYQNNGWLDGWMDIR